MDDLISRRAAIDAIRNIKAVTGTSDDKILLVDKAEAQTELMMLPSAEPRKKGKWIDSRDVSWMCSECGKWLDVLQGDVDMNFCPNCGCQMNGGGEE